MTEKDLIQALYKEAEIYRKQGLYKQSRAKYAEMLELVQQHERLSKDKKLVDNIRTKLQSVEADLAEVEEATDKPQLSEDLQNLIHKLFSFSKSKDMAAVEGAIALAQFGQYDKAVDEFRKLIREGTQPLAAGMNLLRCHLTLANPDAAVAEFKNWLSRSAFSGADLTSLRNFLAQHLEKKGMKADLPAVPQAPSAKEKGPQKEEEEEAIPVTSVSIKIESGPKKGQMMEFEVSFQSGNKISIILPSKQKDVLAGLKKGLRLPNMQCFSAMGVFNGSGTISNVYAVTSGPKKGDNAVEIILESE